MYPRGCSPQAPHRACSATGSQGRGPRGRVKESLNPMSLVLMTVGLNPFTPKLEDPVDCLKETEAREKLHAWGYALSGKACTST